ncbi:SPASM domain-containing protein [Pontiellaceae bacterium B12227]|nr:SPASM domain-containing protein [Pontiellaceae bacterium B12227]
MEETFETNEPPRQIVQAGLGTTPDRGILQSVWFEIPGNCDLDCPYCFCASGGLDNDPENVAGVGTYEWKPYEEFIFKPLAKQIRDWNDASPEERVERFGCPPENAKTDEPVRGKIAIPGAGEPFHPKNRELALSLIRSANSLGLHMTVFTTGHWIDESLAAELAPLDVVLLVKRNSARKEVQNKLAGMSPNHTFFDRREAALKTLMAAGFNKPFGEPGSPAYQKTRMGVVTSIMKENLDELEGLLRFARENNIIFDCDTILERGRAGECQQRLTDKTTELGFRKLQHLDRDLYGRSWEISATYVGTACDRYRHHLYIDKRGTIHPCVGCIADEEHGIKAIDLGNIKEDTHALMDAWNAPVMRKAIRPWNYEGPCSECTLPDKGVCFSCLGRFRDCTVELNRESTGPIPSIGCWNQTVKPK